jgi:hypothetical protein
MSQSRKALTFSILYSLPLLIWLTAQLELLEWNSGPLQRLFQQTLAVLVMLQAFATVLLFLNHSKGEWRDELVAIIHILLFPLPFLVLIWLTGSVSLNILLKSLLLPGSVGAMVFIIQRCNGRVPGKQNIVETASSLFYILLAVLIWNYRDLWWGWSGL